MSTLKNRTIFGSNICLRIYNTAATCRIGGQEVMIFHDTKTLPHNMYIYIIFSSMIITIAFHPFKPNLVTARVSASDRRNRDGWQLPWDPFLCIYLQILELSIHLMFIFQTLSVIPQMNIYYHICVIVSHLGDTMTQT